jgi:hypothetical protein
MIKILFNLIQNFIIYILIHFWNNLPLHHSSLLNFPNFPNFLNFLDYLHFHFILDYLHFLDFLHYLDFILLFHFHFILGIRCFYLLLPLIVLDSYFRILLDTHYFLVDFLLDFLNSFGQ